MHEKYTILLNIFCLLNKHDEQGMVIAVILLNVRDLIWIVNNWNLYIFDCFNRDGWAPHLGGSSRGGAGVDWPGDPGVAQLRPPLPEQSSLLANHLLTARQQRPRQPVAENRRRWTGTEQELVI